MDGPKPAESFLASEGISLGVRLTVHATGVSGVLVDVDGGMVHLTDDLAATITVTTG